MKSRRQWIYVYVWLIHFAVQQKLTEHCKSNRLQYKLRKQTPPKKTSLVESSSRQSEQWLKANKSVISQHYCSGMSSLHISELGHIPEDP